MSSTDQKLYEIPWREKPRRIRMVGKPEQGNRTCRPPAQAWFPPRAAREAPSPESTNTKDRRRQGSSGSFIKQEPSEHLEVRFLFFPFYKIKKEKVQRARMTCPRRRKWQPTPVFLPGKSHGLRILVGYSPWGRKESDTTEWLHFDGRSCVLLL